MIKLTVKEKVNGELAVRRMCDKAVAAYAETDPFSVYELHRSRFDGDEQMYSIRGALGDIDMLTLGQVEDLLLSLYDDEEV